MRDLNSILSWANRCFAILNETRLHHPKLVSENTEWHGRRQIMVCKIYRKELDKIGVLPSLVYHYRTNREIFFTKTGRRPFMLNDSGKRVYLRSGSMVSYFADPNPMPIEYCEPLE